MLRLALLFIVWPILELYVLIQIGRATGAWTTIGIVLLTGLAGAALAKHEGLRTYHRIRSELAAGRIPGDQLVDALLILIAGVLLITPGLISDMVGLAMLIPQARQVVRETLKRRFRARFTFTHFGHSGHRRPDGPTDDDIVDVEVREIERRQLDRGDRQDRPTGGQD